MEESRKVNIVINSLINGETIIKESVGEYRHSNDNHIVVFNDFDGNDITKHAIRASKEQMLLRRMGAIKGDMLFDISKDTLTKYETMGLSHDFIVSTKSYLLIENDNTVVIKTTYSLSDNSSQDSIDSEQTITITYID